MPPPEWTVTFHYPKRHTIKLLLEKGDAYSRVDAIAYARLHLEDDLLLYGEPKRITAKRGY